MGKEEMTMPELPIHTPRGLTTRGSQPLIGIPTREGPDEVVRYFTSDDEVDRARTSDQASIQRALSLAGAWAELDAEDGPDPLDELDRMRHQSTPTPPLEL
jgi:hypothetical protein